MVSPAGRPSRLLRLTVYLNQSHAAVGPPSALSFSNVTETLSDGIGAAFAGAVIPAIPIKTRRKVRATLNTSRARRPPPKVLRRCDCMPYLHFLCEQPRSVCEMVFPERTLNVRESTLNTRTLPEFPSVVRQWSTVVAWAPRLAALRRKGRCCGRRATLLVSTDMRSFPQYRPLPTRCGSS